MSQFSSAIASLSKNAASGDMLEDVPSTHAWNNVQRITFLIIGPLGALACAAALLAQWGDIDGLDRWALPALAGVLLTLSVLLAFQLVRVSLVTISAFVATTLYFLLALNHQFYWYVPHYGMLSESSYWFSVLYATAFITFRIQHAIRICALLFVASLGICAAELVAMHFRGELSARTVASISQFLLSSGVLVLAQFAVGRLRHQLDQVKLAAYLDVLTGLPNRRYAQQVMERMLRSSRPFSLIMLDLDHFKQVNDTFGHQAGDLVLRETARIISRHLGGTQLMSRWGGEEFVLILPGTRKREAKHLAEQARQELNSYAFEEVGRISASFGVAEWGAGDTLETVMQRADTALYAAKRQGRNGVRVAMDDGRLTRMDLTAERPAATPDTYTAEVDALLTEPDLDTAVLIGSDDEPLPA